MPHEDLDALAIAELAARAQVDPVVSASEETVEIDGFIFIWSRAKAASNRRKHGVTFEEAATVFIDPLAKVREDRSEAHSERRMRIMGYSVFGRLLLVVHVEVRDETTIRIISARRLDAKERRQLEREKLAAQPLCEAHLDQGKPRSDNPCARR
jgi:hypothetical protein